MMPPPAGSLLTIDLCAVVANWRLIGARTSADVCAVVKADAYGLGVAEVAAALARAGCRRFVVATLDEGVGLRRLLAAPEIMVLNGPFPGTEAAFGTNRLIPVLNTLEQVARWPGAQPYAVQIDTGMARLGLAAGEVAQAADLLAGSTPVLVMSHLACADEPDHALNRAQLALFTSLRPLLPAAPASLAASSGIFLGAEYHFDVVRPGVALYGGAPNAALAEVMGQVVTLQGKIIQVRDVDRPQTVGYGATWQVPRKSRLAVVSTGYADGLPRALGNRGRGYVGGHPAPLVGRVSMDLTIFDVTDIPANVAQPGALVELLGPHQGVDALARQADTISYEILTGLGARHHRRYLGGAG